MAACHGNVEIIDLLLKAKSSIEYKNKIGWTALHEAFSVGKISAIKFLIDKGAKLGTLSTKGETPLHLLLLNKEVAIDTKKIIIDYCKSKCDLTIKDNDGKTVLDYAKEHCPEVLKLLQSNDNIDLDQSLNEIIVSQNDEIELSGDIENNE
jgi:uncharacterized protein